MSNNMECSLCRLCGYISPDVVNIYSENGLASEYEKKIKKYLYLMVSPEDELSKTICWMCSHKLDSFNRFHDKINEIQQRLLKDKFNLFVISQYLEKKEEFESFLEETHPLDPFFEPNPDPEPEEPTEPPPESEAEAADQHQEYEANEDEPQFPKPIKEEIDDIDVKRKGNSETFEIRRNTRQSSKQLKLIEEKEKNVEPIDDDEEDIVPEKTKKKKRGRPSTNKSGEKKLKRKCNEVPVNYYDDNEGISDNEFPARDSDNDEWPAQETLNKFPEKVIENGLLLVKGKKLMGMICKFYNLECDLCEKTKPRFKQLRDHFQHYSDEHKVEGYVNCCQTKLYRYPAIIMHMARHLQPDAFKCNICGYMVTRPRFLETHKLTHLPEDQKPFGCEHCPRKFCWKGALQIHSISHQPADKRKLYVCHICGKVYDTPSGLSTHKKLIHTERKKESHVCDVCAKQFATRTGLKEHMSTIHQPREKDQVQCSICAKWLMNNRCLKSHMLLHSNIEYKCDKCDYATKKLILLKRHELTQHSDAKPFNCDKCSKSFKLKRALTVHLAQHSTFKSYKCNFCAREFASSTNFYTHRKNIHPKELQALKDEQEQAQRLKRIQAGIEDDAEDENHGKEIEIHEIQEIPADTKYITINNRKYEIATNELDTMIVVDIGAEHELTFTTLPSSTSNGLQ